MLRIESARWDRSLTLSVVDSEHFVAEIRGSDIFAHLNVYSWHPEQSVIEYFESISKQILPWDLARVWESTEGEFRISSVCSSLGYVCFSVPLIHRKENASWEVTADVLAELGQIANMISR